MTKWRDMSDDQRKTIRRKQYRNIILYQVGKLCIMWAVGTALRSHLRKEYGPNYQQVIIERARATKSAS